MLSEDTTGAGGQSHPYFLFLFSVQGLVTGHKHVKLIVVLLMSDVVVFYFDLREAPCHRLRLLLMAFG